jgi:hypothetical protein
MRFKNKIEHFSGKLAEQIIRVHMTDISEVHEWYSHHYGENVATCFLFKDGPKMMIQFTNLPDTEEIDMIKINQLLNRRYIEMPREIRQNPDNGRLKVIDGETRLPIVELNHPTLVVPLKEKLQEYIEDNQLIINEESAPIYGEILSKIFKGLADALHVDKTI